ncbi:MAG: hypothetical protein J6X34_01775 [Clostridia bacterium]|nr:hypothetical protein [Clostridia bacterium]
MRRVPHAEEAFGYSFEKVVLYAWSLGANELGLRVSFEIADPGISVADDVRYIASFTYLF